VPVQLGHTEHDVNPTKVVVVQSCTSNVRVHDFIAFGSSPAPHDRVGAKHLNMGHSEIVSTGCSSSAEHVHCGGFSDVCVTVTTSQFTSLQGGMVGHPA